MNFSFTTHRSSVSRYSYLRASQVALAVKNLPAGDTRDAGSVPGSGRSPGGLHGNPLLYSCLENPMDRGAWRASPWGRKESDTTEATYHAHTHIAANSLQSCPTLCDPIDGSPPGSPVPGILQARTLEWVAISFSNA